MKASTKPSRSEMNKASTDSEAKLSGKAEYYAKLRKENEVRTYVAIPTYVYTYIFKFIIHMQVS